MKKIVKKIFSYINKQLSNPDTVDALRKVNTFDDFKQLFEYPQTTG